VRAEIWHVGAALLAPAAAACGAGGDDEPGPVDAFDDLSAGADACAPALFILLAHPVSMTTTSNAADTRDTCCFIAVLTVCRTAGAALQLRLASHRMASAAGEHPRRRRGMHETSFGGQLGVAGEGWRR
jgi:hypothetical protein